MKAGFGKMFKVHDPIHSQQSSTDSRSKPYSVKSIAYPLQFLTSYHSPMNSRVSLAATLILHDCR